MDHGFFHFTRKKLFSLPSNNCIIFIFRSNRSLVEGEVLVCDAGDLRMRSVLHSVIATPIRVANQKVISRLDSINTQVFYAANQNGIKSLAMPLIGTGKVTSFHLTI